MAKGDSRIFIEVEGGCVQAVWGEDPDVDVTVIDHDTEGMSDEEIIDHDCLVDELEELKQDGSMIEL